MMDVRAGEEARQSPDEAEAADGAPADVFDEAVGGIGVGSDHHVAAGEFAVVEGEEEGGVAILYFFFREAVREGEMLELHEAGEYAENVAELAPAFEAAVGGFGYVGGEAESEEIQEIEFALGVAEADHVAGAAGIFLQGRDRVFDAALGEIFQEGIAGAQREEAQRGAAWLFGFREKTVDDFEGGAVAAHRQEIPRSRAVGLARDFGGFSGAGSMRDGEINSGVANSL